MLASSPSGPSITSCKPLPSARTNRAKPRFAASAAAAKRSACRKRCANALMMHKALYQSALISTGLPMRGVTTQSPTLASIQVSCTPAVPPRSSPSVPSTPIPKRVPFWCHSIMSDNTGKISRKAETSPLVST
jgi:hypothetical protein